MERAGSAGAVKLTAAATRGLGELELEQPPGTFALTPASHTALQAIFEHRDLLAARGLDWGTGVGCLAIAAARIPGVEHVLGLDISGANVEAARANARRNGVAGKVSFAVADSYCPADDAGREALNGLRGKASFILANAPASTDGDGFEWRREVLRGAREYLADGGCAFLSISSRYGELRIQHLELGVIAEPDQRSGRAKTPLRLPKDL